MSETTANGDARVAGERERTVAQVGERRIIDLFTRAARTEPACTAGDLVIGSGDDGAVLDLGGPVVVSSDTAVQDRHFRLEWSAPADIGARAVVASAADIAAMGARTVGVVVSLACPPGLSAGTLLDVNDGIVSATQSLGARVLGGDLVEAGELVVTVTCLGALDGRPPVRLDGACAGDVLAVSGPLGAAAAGYAVLAAEDRDLSAGPPEFDDPNAEVVAAFRVPRPDPEAGTRAARAGAHAMTDISDGLLAELITMARASRVDLSVRRAAIPTTAAVRDVARRRGADAADWALTGGEDHELLAAFADGDVPAGWTVLGQVTRSADASGSVLVDGRRVDGSGGWRTFGAPGGSAGPADGD